MVITNPELIATNFVRAIRVFENGDTVETVIVKSEKEANNTGLRIDNPTRLCYTYFLLQDRLIGLWYNNIGNPRIHESDCVVLPFVLDVLHNRCFHSTVYIWKTKPKS